LTGSVLAATPGDWSIAPLQIAVLLIASVAYARRVHTLRRRGRPVGPGRQAWFYGGIGLLLLALTSPIGTLGQDRLFYAHMAQHLMIGDLAALAIVLGLNGAILRPVLALPLLARLRVLAHPLVAFPLWVANLVLWHVPAIYETALANTAVHALQHSLFFATGALMWAAVVEPLPGPRWFGTAPKAIYVLAVRTVGAVLASAFIWSEAPFYSWYAPGEARAGIDPVTDQAIGGLIMFVEGGVVTLVAFAWLFLRWSREAELRQSLLDRGHAPRVAERAARYGRSPVDGARAAPPDAS
jgi:putative membrane protein